MTYADYSHSNFDKYILVQRSTDLTVLADFGGQTVLSLDLGPDLVVFASPSYSTPSGSSSVIPTV